MDLISLISSGVWPWRSRTHGFCTGGFKRINPAEHISLQAISKQMAEISARLVELEEAQKTQALPNEALRRLEGMEKSLQSTHREGSKLPSDSCLPEQVGTQLDELSGLVSKALKVAENSECNIQALRFDLVVEQDQEGRAADAAQDGHQYPEGPGLAAWF